MKKIICTILSILMVFTLVSCKKITLDAPKNLQVSEEGLVSWSSVENAIEYVVTINDTENHTVTTNIYQVEDITKAFTVYVVAKGDSKKILDSLPSDKVQFNPTTKPDVPKPPKEEIKIGISSKSEVMSGQSIKLTANVTGTTDTSVTWEIKTGSEFASIDAEGNLKANSVDGDKVIEVIARSNKDTSVTASKIITIVAKPELTADMLNAINHDRVGFEGYINISLYTIGLFEKLDSTYTINIKTSMDGTNWYAQYENSQTGTIQDLYYKNHNGLACQVGVSFMNDEEYFPMLDELGKEVSFTDSGLYNSLKGLKVSDFTFNEETWRYEYTGLDTTLASKIVAAANPYDFDPIGFGLIIEDGEIMGVYAKSNDDYTISQGYKAIQELYVFMNCGDSVEVPTIAKYSYDAEVHDDLQAAIDNMKKLDSYTLDFKEMTQSYLSTSTIESGFTETITATECHFRPYTVRYDSQLNEHHDYTLNASYGYKKINDNLYNTYFQNSDGSYGAVRAYNSEFNNAKPTFEFAAEIFRNYYVDTEKGTTTYYVDDVMSSVASTFYYGVGNDINLYGIFATRGYVNSSSFTPFVVVKDGYIVEACFYFYIGTIYGIVQIEYSDFNNTTLPEGTNIEFETRFAPTSWSELTINVSLGTGSSTEDDYEENALKYLKEFYGNENIEDLMPFFGNVLGDTYGFGLTTIHMPAGSTSAKNAIVFYYDVPLDIDYTIDSSLKAVEEYLISLGFVKNLSGEFKKGDIVIAPMDMDLDFVIYVWKA